MSRFHIEPLEVRALLASAVTPVLLDPLTQPKFVNPLPIPSVIAPTTPGGTHYAVDVSQFQQDLGLVDSVTHAPLLTTVWGYNGSYPGPTFVAQKGTPITVTYSNKLIDSAGQPLPHLLPIDQTIMSAYTDTPYTIEQNGVPLVTHLHGGHVDDTSDGNPYAWFAPNNNAVGPRFESVYTYANDQDAATLWYHDHALGFTRLNVYAGLAGFYLLRDGLDTGAAGNAIGLPTGKYEVGLAIQDRMFTADGQLFYPSEDPDNPLAPSPTVLPEMFGDTILVNGKAWPYFDVEPHKYRLHLLNGSDSRFLTLSLSGGAGFTQVGSDQGLLRAPVSVTQLTLGPGERADVVVDFANLKGQTIVMRNIAKTPFPAGSSVDPRTTGQVMAFRVGKKATTPDVPLAKSFQTITPLTQDGPTRQVALFEGTDEYGRVTPRLGTVNDGALGFADPATEIVRLGDTEVWEVYNTTEDAHPIHLHLVKFQVIGRQKFTAADVDPDTGALRNIRLHGSPKRPAPNETGWKDTVLMYPGEVTRIIATFDKAGEYVWHCHILSHEEHDMMRPLVVKAAMSTSTADVFGAVPIGPTFAGDRKDGVAALLEDVQSM